MRKSQALILIMGLALSACSNQKGIRVLTNDGNGPDEFVILPSKPLSAPEDYSALPPPTPGGTNITDVDPIGDALAVLGGKRTPAVSGQVGTGDQGLVSYVARKGTDANIRATLAEEDAKLRKRRGRFTNIKLVKTDSYNKVYKFHHLDAYQELARWRRAGAKTPAVPPQN